MTSDHHDTAHINLCLSFSLLKKKKRKTPTESSRSDAASRVETRTTVIVASGEQAALFFAATVACGTKCVDRSRFLSGSLLQNLFALPSRGMKEHQPPF